MRIVTWTSLNPKEQRDLLKRPVQNRSDLAATIASIIADVRREGDHALRAMTRTFDKVELEEIRVSAAAVQAAYAKVTDEEMAAILRAKEQITAFHKPQIPAPLTVETAPGIVCRKRALPIDRVGLYIPGGTAPLVSTVLMLAVPATLAGCTTKVLCSPPQRDGSINPYVLVAADMCGIKEIFAVGGAQAIAAMAFGTESVPKVDKIFGPGNTFVTQAKMAVALDPDGAALDMPAGPSEVMVVVDATSDPLSAAADLLSQAEHGEDSQVVLVSLSAPTTDRIHQELERQLANLPRKAICAAALSHSVLINADHTQDVLRIINQYAPEHLILLQENARTLADHVTHAGSIFIGPWTPESVGDYASGTNHVLPTYGYARAHSGLGTEAFMKYITYQELTAQGLQDIGPVVQTLADLEQLAAHKNAVTVRLQRLRQTHGS